MKIEGTELECMACDEVCLDYYLGEFHETKEQWAKRVYDFCKEYKETDGFGYPLEAGGFWSKQDKEYYNLNYDKKKLPSVYARDAEDLWEEKKRRRRAAFVKECTGEDCDPELLKPENIKKDLKEKKECKWKGSHSTANILMMKTDPKFNYKTATERHHQEEAKLKRNLEKDEEKIAKNVSKLRKKFDDETIAIIYPQGEKYLKQESLNGIPAVGKK